MWEIATVGISILVYQAVFLIQTEGGYWGGDHSELWYSLIYIGVLVSVSINF